MDSWDVLLSAFIKDHSGELLFLTLTCITVLTLIILVPQLLRASQRKAEMIHQERIRALEQGIPLPIDDDRARVAGRTALLVPAIVMLTAGTVTCFLIAYKAETLFAVSLAIWVVAGVVSLAAITGGVALIAQLARIQARQEDDDEEDVPEENQYTG